MYLEDRSSAVWVERALYNLGPVQAWFLRSSFDLLLPGSIEPGSVPLMLLSSPAEYRPTASGWRERRSAELLSTRAPLVGCGALQRMRSREPAEPGGAYPGTFRPRGFSLRGGFLLPVLPGLFHPGTLLGFSLQSFLLREWGAPLDASSPPAVAASLHPWLGFRTSHPGVFRPVRLGFRGLLALGARSRVTGG